MEGGCHLAVRGGGRKGPLASPPVSASGPSRAYSSSTTSTRQGGPALLEGLVDGLEAQVDQLLHPLRGALAASDAGVLGSRGQADQAVGHAAGVALDGELGIARAQDDAAPGEKKERGHFGQWQCYGNIMANGSSGNGSR